MPHSYLGLGQLKPYLNDTTTRDDAAYVRALEAVSQQIDDWLDRTFQPYTATHHYTADDAATLSLDDVLSVSAVRMDQDGDRTYETTLSTSDWDLAPYNAAQREQPYTALEIQPQGQYALVTMPRGIQVVGDWGYWDRRTTLSVTVSTANSVAAGDTAIVMSAPSTAVQPGHTLLIDSERMYVTAVSSATVSVSRAQHGTSASTHSTASAIQRYEYPTPIVEATRIQASRLFKRKDAPFGSFAGPSDMVENVVEVARLDPDVEQLIKHYHRIRWLAV